MESKRNSPALTSANFPGDSRGVVGKRSFLRELPEPDVFIVTSGGRRIPAHTGILVGSSSSSSCSNLVLLRFLVIGSSLTWGVDTVTNEGIGVAGTGEPHIQAHQAPELREDRSDSRRSLRRRLRFRRVRLLLQVSRFDTRNAGSYENSNFGREKEGIYVLS